MYYGGSSFTHMKLITEFWWQFEDYWVGSVSLANHAEGFWSYSNPLTHCATLPRVSEQLIKSWELTFSRILLKFRSWCFKTDHSGSRSVTKTSHVFHISFWNWSVYLWGYICNFLFFIQKLPFFFNYSPQNRRIAMSLNYGHFVRKNDPHKPHISYLQNH